MNSIKWRNTESTLKELEEKLRMNPYMMFFDTETTGLRPGTDKIIQLSGIKLDKDFNVLQTFNELSNPFPLTITDKITEITGIKNEDVASARSEREVLADFIASSSRCTYFAYNSSFDANMCEKSMSAYGQTIHMVHFDVLKLARDVLCNDNLENHKLATVAKHLDVVPDEQQFHNALFDVKMTIEVFKALLHRLSEDGYVRSEGKICPKIWAIRPWEVGKTRRLYIATAAGSLYYDKITHVWGDKDAGIDTINMDYIERMCNQMATRAGYDALYKVDKEVKYR